MGKITRDKNADNLKKQYKNLTGSNTFKVYSLIDLYGMGNIYNMNTFRYEVNKSLSPSGKHHDTYFNTITKYLEPSKRQQNATIRTHR